jgi:hypothetical protein
MIKMPAVGPNEEAETRGSAEAPVLLRPSDATTASTSEDQAEISSASEDTAQSEIFRRIEFSGVSPIRAKIRRPQIFPRIQIHPQLMHPYPILHHKPTGFVAGRL